MVSYSEAIWKASKARDTYGPIVDLVKKQQELARKTGLPTNISDEVPHLSVLDLSGCKIRNITTFAFQVPISFIIN